MDKDPFLSEHNTAFTTDFDSISRTLVCYGFILRWVISRSRTLGALLEKIRNTVSTYDNDGFPLDSFAATTSALQTVEHGHMRIKTG